MQQKQRAQSTAGRDIGPIPTIQQPKRRQQCARNFRLFMETYFPKTFRLKWSPDHLRLIAKIQTAVLVGGLQAFAMPRGTGKSVICTAAMIWSALYGHHLFQVLICANADMAEKSLQPIRFELETNELLAADFPEACYPIHCLERVAQRANGQTCQGNPTYLNWSGSQLVFPTISDAPSSGAVIYVAGLQEAVRGSKLFHPPTGGIIRPTLVIIDDFQTRDSARSLDECVKRLQIVTSDVNGMVGPGAELSVLVPGTIIEPGDAMAMLLDRETHPEYRGEICKLLYSFPDNMELWDQYDAIRRQSLKQFDESGNEPESMQQLFAECNKFYRKHRKAMDAGAQPAWEQRKKPHELSAVQNAMNLYFQNIEMFYTEYQNDPLSALDQDSERLSQAEITCQLSGHERGEIPETCQYVTCGIDVHKRILYYTLTAWTPAFDGYVIDYGTWPKPRTAHFTERNVRPTLAELYPKRGVEAAIYSGLEELTRQLFTRPLNRTDGVKMHLGLCLIDSAWKPDPVFQVCTATPYDGRVAPSLGRFLGCNDKELSRCKPKRGEHIGLEWTIPPTHGKQVRQVQYDTYFWKTFFHARLATAIGDAGSLALFGKMTGNRASVDHGFYARHLDAEYSLPVTGRRTVDEWKMRPGESQNHWFDSSVMSTVAASVLGASVIETKHRSTTKKKRRVIQD